MKSKRNLALLVAFVMCLTVVLTSCDKLSKKDIEADPVGRVVQSVCETSDSIVKSLSPLDPIRAAEKKGRFELTLAPAETDAKFGFSYAYDVEAKKAAGEFSMDSGEDSVSMNLSADSDNVAFSVPGLYEGAYGVQLSTLMEDMKDSQLLALSGVEYEELVKQLQPMLDSMNSAAGVAELSGDWDKLGADLKARLNKCVSGIDKKEVTVGGESVKAYEVTFKLVKGDFVDIFGILRDDLKPIFDEYSKMISNMPVAGDGSADADDVFDYSEIAEIFDNDIEEINKDGNDINAEITAYLSPKTADFMALKYVMNAVDGENKMSDKLEGTIELGSDRKITGTMKTTENYDGEETSVYDCKFTVECVDDDKTFSVKTTIDEVGSHNTVIEFTNDKTEKTYIAKVSLTDNYEGEDSAAYNIEVSGKMEYDAANLMFSVDKVAGNNSYGTDKSVDGIGLTFKLSADAGEITVPEYKNVFKMTAGEFLDLGMAVQSNGENLASVVESFGEKMSDAFPDIDIPGDSDYITTDPDDFYNDYGGELEEGELSLFDICENFDETFDYNYDGVIDESDREEWEAEFKPFGSVFDETYDYDGDGKPGTDIDRSGYEMMVALYKTVPVYDENSSDFEEYYASFNEDYDYDGDGKSGTDADRAEYDKYYKIFADEFDPTVDYDQDGKVDSDDKEWYDLIRMY